jgi:fructose-bisphosphate aldolase, class I
MSGKLLKLNRFRYRYSRHGLVIPIDHGLTLGPIAGIESVRSLKAWITHPAICGVVVHKGMAERLAESRMLDGLGVMVHLNGMLSLSADADTKELLTSVERAVALGADGVSFQVNFNGKNDSHNLRLMGKLTDEAAKYSLPVLAMIYDKVPADDKQAIVRLRHLLRAAIEMGCDAVKIAPPETAGKLPEILSGISEDILVYVAGGTMASESQVYDLARETVRAGGTGLCVGRNVFGRKNFAEVLSQLKDILAPRPLQVSELPVPQGVAYGLN